MLFPTRSSSAWKPPPATRENLYHELQERGYVLRLLHPRQTHQFHERQGLRAKTDRLDAMTIAKVLLSGEARAGGRAVAGRAVSLRILCDQLEHTRANLARLETEIEQLLTNDPQVKGLQHIPEFGSKTVAVLRAELGDVQRFARTDEVIAYGGMDVEIKESEQWKGRAKLSKRGSGPARDACSTWQRSAAFTWRAPLLAPTTIDWSSVASKKAQL